MSAGSFIILFSIIIGTFSIASKILKLIEWHIKYDVRPVSGKRYKGSEFDD